MSKRQSLLAEIGKLNDEVKTIFDEAGDDALDTQTWEKVKGNNKEIERLEGEVVTLSEQEESRKSAAERSRLRTPGRDAEGEKSRDSSAPKTIGQAMFADPEFKAFYDRVAIKGQVSRAQFGNSPAFNVPGGMKTLLTGASNTSAGALAYPQFLGVQDSGSWMRPLTIRDIITIGTTDSDTVDYVRQNGVTNNAAAVAEATATSGSTGTKPESAMTFEVVSETVKSIAHWIPATRRAMADAAQLRTYVDMFLRYGVEEELEDQIIAGDGTSNTFTGVLNFTGTTAQAWDTNILTTTRKARTKVKTTGRAVATAFVLNPTDWETLDLLQDNEARYFFGGPSVLGTPRLWGLPVVESEAMTVGYGVVADWKKAVLWDREVAQILVSDSHSDFFIRNMIAILCELRAAFTLLRPAAFVEMDLTA